MAEARSAVARLKIPAKSFEEDPDSLKSFWCEVRKSLKRRYYQTRNSIRNGLWPTSLWNLGAAYLFVLFLMYTEFNSTSSIRTRLWTLHSEYVPMTSSLPTVIGAMVTAILVAFIFFFVLMHVRRELLRILLSYHGWMYEAPRTQSVLTVMWALVVKLVSGYRPSLYSCQKSLPRLSVPPLKDTVRKCLASLKPLLSEEEYKQLEAQAKDFLKKVGPKVQRILHLKSWWSQNYVSDWWEKYVYLMSRDELPLNSNYYIMDYSYYVPTDNQLARSAFVITKILDFKRLVDREQLEPLVIRGTVPLCMAQYERIFSTTRMPGLEYDRLYHWSSKRSKHVVVYRKGLYYKMDVMDVSGQVLTMQSLEKQLKWIIDNADKQSVYVSEEERMVACLTGAKRDVWYKTVQDHFQTGVNKESLDIINKAIMIVVLSEDAPRSLSEKGKMLLHADGRSIWYDKCVNVIFFTDGQCGVNCEHALADAPVYGHVLEYCFTNEVLNYPYCECGRLNVHPSVKQAGMTSPVLLQWQIADTLKPLLHSTLTSCIKKNDDIDLILVDHDAYGKGFIKKCKVSPDAYIQMALQLAYFRDASHFVLTYEASMTRLYSAGRTETVRSCTQHAINFVRAMVDDSVPDKEKVRLLRVAGNHHQNLYRDAMNGLGIDRHMFAMYVTCKGLSYESAFLQSIMGHQWTLSTSQQPQQQMAATDSLDKPEYYKMVSPGGGFGPVSDDGYGVSYMIPRNDKIFFHISSKRSSQKTDTLRFVSLLNRSLSDMRQLCERVIHNGNNSHR